MAAVIIYGYAMEGIQTIHGFEGLCYKHECVFYILSNNYLEIASRMDMTQFLK